MWVRGGSLGGGVSGGGAAVVGGGAVGGGGRPMWIPYCSNPDPRNISAAPEFAGKTDCLKVSRLELFFCFLNGMSVIFVDDLRLLTKKKSGLLFLTPSCQVVFIP